MRLHHVSLELRREDADANARFWETLGFGEVDPPEGLRGRVRWFQRDGHQIHLVYVDEPAIARVGHPAIHAEDYDGAIEALREAGYEPRPGTEYWGEPRSFVHTPAGHRVEIMSAPPPE
jgi:catechol 2,3-dioxygenase-like lactoylglutathione lyase family enzyme